MERKIHVAGGSTVLCGIYHVEECDCVSIKKTEKATCKRCLKSNEVLERFAKKIKSIVN